MAHFFIGRPTVAIVISILTVIMGSISVSRLPVEQYPALAPPTIRVETTYPGAGAEVVEQSVATPIEQQMNGVDNMIYMKSLNTSDGRLQLDVTFQVGMNLDMANVLAQNRVSWAQARLPQEVTRQGVTAKKLNPSILMAVSIYSPKSTYDSNFLINYAMINVRDAFLRVPGVAQVDLFGGAEYAMRIWLRPDAMARLGLNPSDVLNAVREQNLQAPAGNVGGAPAPPGQEFTYTVQTPARYLSPGEFDEIIIRSNPDGSQVKLKDIGRADLGQEFYKSFGRLNGGPAGVLAVYLLPGANQVQSAENLYKTLEGLKRGFPEDVDYEIVYDTTPAVEASIHSIVHTLVEAVILVIIVVFVFLQNVRATIIPLLTVPVSLLGAFIFFPMIGFTVNTLSMFGMVLAIGIVVDDAIVVVEAVMHHLEHGMSPLEATKKAMDEVSGPVIGIALILSAVFIPVAFLGGLTGRLYQQFALTIAISVLISAFNALSLSPALAVMMLRAPSKKKNLLQKLFGGFNTAFTKTTNVYVKVAGLLARKAVLALVLLGVVTWGGVTFAKILPKGFIPDEDQGLLIVHVQSPNASSLDRTDRVCRKVEEIMKRAPGVNAFNTVGGLAMLNNTFTPNVASVLIRLKPWEERKAPELQQAAILAWLRKELAALPDAISFPFSIPTLPGFGAASGFNFILQDRSGTLSVQQLGEESGRFLAEARKRPELMNLFTSFDPTTPQLRVEVDRDMARKLGLPIDDVYVALSTLIGGSYVNDFNRFGRLYRVYVQAEGEYRSKPDDLGRMYVRSATTGRMIPLSAIASFQPASGTELTVRYNLFRSVEITGAAAPGYTSGQAMDALEEVADEVLPREMGYEFTGMSYQEKNSPSPGPTFIMAVVFVFLLLAAMYESWTLPFSVLLGTPLVLLGAFFGVWMMGLENNVFVQVGLVMLIGLAAKNAILIVEFAKMKRDAGAPAYESAMEGAKLRFRPILMTAFAFILGVVPLMIATGAGAASRQVMGTAVFWGMLIATAGGVLVVPALYVLMEKLSREKKPVTASEPPLPEAPSVDMPSGGGH
ncbi:MAG TPA: multidrug efflux RND transporter permease subunit [Planctomycetota bacterium]|nr:multidrug efflux RND transporter permease subunit [Planctomycetota bacterium]